MLEITTRTEHIYRHASGIIYCKVLKGAYVDLEDARENVEAVRSLSEGKRARVLIDIRESGGASKASRDFFASEETAAVQEVGAILVNSPLSVLIGSFFLGLNRTKFPVSLFRHEEAAIEWLLSYGS